MNRLASIIACRRIDIMLVLITLLTVSLAWLKQGDDLEQLTASRPEVEQKTRAGKWYREKISFQGVLLDQPRYHAPGLQRFGVELLGRAEKILVKAPAMPWQPRLQQADRIVVDGVYLIPPPSGFATFLSRSNFSAYVLANRVRLDGEERVAEEKQAELIRRYASEGSFEVIAAVVLGARDQLSETTKELFRALGCSHLLVVSGFHVAVMYALARTIFAFFFSLFPGIYLRIPKPVLLSSLGFLAAGLYSMNCGFAVPVSRALLVLFLYVCAELSGRRSTSCRSILLSFLTVQLIWPGSIFEPGCQLTFAAILGIAVTMRCFSLPTTESGLKGLPRRAYNLFILGAGAWFATSPIVAMWFGQFVPLSALTNLVVSLPFSFCFVFLGGTAVVLCLIGVPGADLLLELAISVCSAFLEGMQAYQELLECWGLGELKVSEEFRFAYGWIWLGGSFLCLFWVGCLANWARLRRF